MDIYVQSTFLTPVSFVPCFSAQPCQQLWGDSAGQEQLGDSHRELIKPALLAEKCLVNQALSVLKLCMGILNSWGSLKFFPLLKTTEMLLLFRYSSLTESFGLLTSGYSHEGWVLHRSDGLIVLFPLLFSLVLLNTFIYLANTVSLPKEVFIQPLTKLLLKGNLVQQAGRLGKWP